MVIPIYTVQDALVGFQVITMMNNDAFAMRSFAENFSEVKNPSDYSLWRVGTFDTDTGIINSEVPTVVCRATDFVKGE